MAGLISLADLAYLLQPIVPARWMCALAQWRGRVRYRLGGSRTTIVRNNLASVLAESPRSGEIEGLTRSFFEFHQLRGLLLALAPQWSAERLARQFPIEGVEHLDQALARGKGVILLGSHLNSVCMFIAILSLRRAGYDVRVAISDTREPFAPTLVRRCTNRLTGTKTLSQRLGMFYCQFNIRPIFQALSKNAIVGQTGDGLHSAAFVETEFLGRTLPFTSGMMSVAQATQAAVVPLFSLGEPPGNIRIVLEPPMHVEQTEDRDEGVRAAVTTFVDRLDHHVRANMACWEHWLIENTFETMKDWKNRSLKERYAYDR